MCRALKSPSGVGLKISWPEDSYGSNIILDFTSIFLLSEKIRGSKSQPESGPPVGKSLRPELGSRKFRPETSLESLFYIKGFEGFGKGRKSGLKITERAVNN